MLHSFDAGDNYGHEGTNASIAQRSQSGAMDILKKHQSKSSTSTAIGRLPDPRAMAEIRSGLEDESSEAEVVRDSVCFPVSLH